MPRAPSRSPALVFFNHDPHLARPAAVVISGVAQAFGGPAYQSLMPTLVGKEDLPNAIALNSIQFNLSRIIGPLVAGVALAAFGMADCFGLNGLSFLRRHRRAPLAARRPRAADVHRQVIVSEMKDGLRYVHGSPRSSRPDDARRSLTTFLGLPLLTFLPVFAKDVFHQDVDRYTRMMTSSGVGAVCGALIVAWLGKHRHLGRILLGLLSAFGVAMTASPLSREVWLSTTILFFTGALLVMCFSVTNSLVQLIAPPELRGRVVSIYMVAFRGGCRSAGWRAAG